MLTILCDLCDTAIRDTGYLCDLVGAKFVYNLNEAPTVSERGNILSLYVCDNCAARVQRTIHTIRAQNQQAAQNHAQAS